MGLPPEGRAAEGGAAPSASAAPAAAEVAPAAAGEVHALLAGIGLARYSQRIAAAGVATVEALRALRDEDMRQAGMLPGHVRLLKKHLAARAAEGQPGASAGGARASAPPRPAKRLRVPSDGREAAALVEPEAAALAEGRGLQVQEIALRAAAEFAALSCGPAGVGAELAGAVPEGETRHLLALRTAQAAAACAEPEPPGPEDTPLALALLAEESAQLAATLLSFCSWPRADAGQLAGAVEAAQQAAQRASWAAVAAVAYPDSPDYDGDWSQRMRRAAVRAAEAAEQYARECASATAAAGAEKVAAVRRVFCKFHAEHRCARGQACEFTHDPAVLPPLPPSRKTELECVFFSKGQCNRAAGCPFAHGPEEMAQIRSLRQAR